MFLEVLSGILSLSNSFIAVFIVIYAFLFLKKTKSHRERRPWDYLIVASIIYLLFTFLSILITIYRIERIYTLSVVELNIFFQFLYSSLILLAFISQTDLIFKNELIIITRKLSPHEKRKLHAKLTDKEEEDAKAALKKKKDKVYIS